MTSTQLPPQLPLQPSGPANPTYKDLPPRPSAPLMPVPEVWPQDPASQEQTLKAIEHNLKILRDQQDWDRDSVLVPRMQEQAFEHSQAIEAGILMQPPQSPEEVEQYRAAIQGISPFLRPELVQGLNQTLDRHWQFRELAAGFGKTLDEQLSKQYWPFMRDTERRTRSRATEQTEVGHEVTTEERDVRNPSTGEWVDERKAYGDAGFGPFRNVAKGFVTGATGGDSSVRGSAMSMVSAIVDRTAESWYQDRIASATGKTFADLPRQSDREMVRGLLSEVAQARVQKAFPDKESEAERGVSFAQGVGSAAGFLVPAAAIERASVTVASKIPWLSRAIAGAGEARQLTAAGRMVGHVAAPSALQAIAGYAKPLTAEQKMRVDAAPDSRKQHLEEAFRWDRATQEGIMNPIYMLVGKIGGSAGGFGRKLAQSLGLGAAAPAIAEAGSFATDKFNQLAREHGVQSTSTEIVDEFARRGTYGPLQDFIEAKSWKERWSALERYAEHAAPGMIVFGALTAAQHLGLRGGRRGEMMRRLKQVEAEIDQQEVVPEQAREEIKQEVRARVDAMMLDSKSDAVEGARERLATEVGGDAEAHAELQALSAAERHAPHLKGATLDEKIANLRHEIEHGDMEPAVERAAQLEIQGLEALRTATDDVSFDEGVGHLKAAMEMREGAMAPVDRPEPTGETDRANDALQAAAHIEDNAPAMADAIIESRQEPERVIAEDDKSKTQLVRTKSGKVKKRTAPAPEVAEAAPAASPSEATATPAAEASPAAAPEAKHDPVYEQAKAVAEQMDHFTVRGLMKSLGVGHKKAKVMVERLEADGVISRHREGKVESFRTAKAERAKDAAKARQQARAKLVQDVVDARDPAAAQDAIIKLEDDHGSMDADANAERARSDIARALAADDGVPANADALAGRLGVSRKQAQEIAERMSVLRAARKAAEAPDPDSVEEAEIEDVNESYRKYVERQGAAGVKAADFQRWRRDRARQKLRRISDTLEKPLDEVSPEVAQALAQRDVESPRDRQVEAYRRLRAEEDMDPSFGPDKAARDLDLQVGVLDGLVDNAISGIDEGVDPGAILEGLASMSEMVNSPLGKIIEHNPETAQVVRRARRVLKAFETGDGSLIPGNESGRILLVNSRDIWEGAKRLARGLSFTRGVRGTLSGMLRLWRAARYGNAKRSQEMADTVTPREPTGIMKSLVGAVNKLDAFGESELASEVLPKALRSLETATIVAEELNRVVPETAPQDLQEAWVRSLESGSLVGRRLVDTRSGSPSQQEAAAALNAKITQANQHFDKVKASHPRAAEVWTEVRRILSEFRSMSAEVLPSTRAGRRMVKWQKSRAELDANRIAELDAHITDLQAAIARGGSKKKLNAEIRSAKKKRKTAEASLRGINDHVTKIEDALRDFTATWGRQDYFPAIPKILRDLVAGPQKSRGAGATITEVLDHEIMSGHWFRRLGELEAQGNRDINVVRAMFHYAKDVLSVGEFAKWWERNEERIDGKHVPIPANKVGHGGQRRVWLLDKQKRVMRPVNMLGTFLRVPWTDTKGVEHVSYVPYGKGVSAKVRAMTNRAGKPSLEVAWTHDHSMRFKELREEQHGGEGPDGAVVLPGVTRGVKASREYRSPIQTIRREFTSGMFWDHEPGKYQKMLSSDPTRPVTPEAASYSNYLEQVVRRAIGQRDLEAWDHAINAVARFVANQQLGNYLLPAAVRNHLQALGQLSMDVGLVRAMTSAHWGIRLHRAVNVAVREMKKSGTTLRDLSVSGRPDKPTAWFNKLEAAVQIPAAKIAKLTGKSRTEAEHYNEAAVALVRSPFLAAPILESYGERHAGWRPGKPLFRTGLKGKIAKVMDYAPGYGRKGLAFFGVTARWSQAHSFMAHYVTQRGAGKTAEQARDIATRATIAEHAYTNKAMDNELSQSPPARIGMLMANWMWQMGLRNYRLLISHGRFSERRAAAKAAIGPAPADLSPGQAVWRGLKASPRTVAAPLASHLMVSARRTMVRMAYMVMAQQAGQMLTRDWSRWLGATVESVPIVGKTASFAVRSLLGDVGWDQDPTTGDQPDWRRDVGDWMSRNAPMLAAFTNDPGGTFQLGQFRADLPMPLLPGNFRPYVLETFEDFGDAAKAWLDGDKKTAEKAIYRFAKNLMAGGWTRIIEQAADPEDPLSPGRRIRRETGTGIMLERISEPSWLRWTMTMLGPELARGVNWSRRSMTEMGEKLEANERKSDRWEIVKHLMGALRAKADGDKATADAGLDEASKLFRASLEDSGAPLAPGEVKSRWVALLREADANNRFSSAERSMFNAQTSDDKTNRLAALLDDPYNQPSKELFAHVFGSGMVDWKRVIERASPEARARLQKAMARAEQRWAREEHDGAK